MYAIKHVLLSVHRPAAFLSRQCEVCLQAIGEHLRLRPELLPQILTTLFEIVLFEDCANQWSMSRPMLSLILLNEQIYNKLQSQIIASQPVTSSCCLPVIAVFISSIQTELAIASLTHSFLCHLCHFLCARGHRDKQQPER